MKFAIWEVLLEGDKYTVLEAHNVPTQLRTVFMPNDVSTILGNALGYKYLMELFLIIGSYKHEKTILIVPDNSRKYEAYQGLYPNGEFHKNIVLCNYEYTHMTGKLFKRIYSMKKYSKKSEVELAVPRYNFDKIDRWKLENTLHVKKYGNWLVLSSNYDGFTYMAKEAESFTDIVDDPNEYFAHGHLFILTKLKDELDIRYYFEE